MTKPFFLISEKKRKGVRTSIREREKLQSNRSKKPNKMSAMRLKLSVILVVYGLISLVLETEGKLLEDYIKEAGKLWSIIIFSPNISRSSESSQHNTISCKHFFASWSITEDRVNDKSSVCENNTNEVSFNLTTIFEFRMKRRDVIATQQNPGKICVKRNALCYRANNDFTTREKKRNGQSYLRKPCVKPYYE